MSARNKSGWEIQGRATEIVVQRHCSLHAAIQVNLVEHQFVGVQYNLATKLGNIARDPHRTLEGERLRVRRKAQVVLGRHQCDRQNLTWLNRSSEFIVWRREPQPYAARQENCTEDTDLAHGYPLLILAVDFPTRMRTAPRQP